MKQGHWAGMIAAILAVPGLTACTGHADEGQSAPASTLVTVAMPSQGTMPVTLDAYGTVGATVGSIGTLSMAQAGQVLSIDTVVGDRVAAGQVLVRMQPAASVRSAYAQALHALKAAREQQRSAAKLMSAQLATRDQLSAADQALADAQSNLAALRETGAGERVIALRAPFAGLVTALGANPGDRVAADVTLVTLARGGAMLASVGVSPADLDKLHLHAHVDLKNLDGQENKDPIHGSIQRISRMLDPTTRQITVDVAFPAGRLPSGSAVKATIETQQRSGWIIPHVALVEDSDGQAHVFQVLAGKAKAIPVILLSQQNGKDLVQGAIHARRPLVVEGAYQLADGDPVRQERRP